MAPVVGGNQNIHPQVGTTKKVGSVIDLLPFYGQTISFGRIGIRQEFG